MGTVAGDADNKIAFRFISPIRFLKLRIQNLNLQSGNASWHDCLMVKELNPRKNPAAVALGRLGGLKGGPALAAKMTPAQRKAAARKAALARWEKEPKKP